MERDLISVIVAVYNQEKYVAKCLKSICNQSYHNLEIVVVNDGSNDNSLAIIEKYQQRDSRIRVISKVNEGLAFARRDGLVVANGKYIVFVDSDDYLTLNAIQTLYLIAERHQADTVIGNYYRKYGVIKRKNTFFSELPVNQLIQGGELFEKYFISFFGHNVLPVNVWGRIYRMDVIEMAMKECSLYDPMCRQMGEDEYFNMQLFPFIRSLYVTDDFVSVYRYGGMTNTYNKNLTSLFDFSDLRIRFLDRYHYDKGYFPLFIEYKNILNSELLQRIQYLEQDESTLITYLQEELSNRYLVQRMRSYFQSEVPSSLSPIIEASYEEIYLYARGLASANRSRFLIKNFMYRVIKSIGI